MNNRKIDRVSRRKGRISWLLTGVGVVAAMLVASMVLGSVTVHAGEPPTPTYTPVPPTEEPPVPTPTTEPGALIFTGEFAITDPDCGDGTFAMTLTPDKSGIVLLVVVGFRVSGMPNDNQTEFDPPVPVAGDGTFNTSGPLPPPLEIILSTLEGSFDFGVDPATVSGTLTIALVADPSVVLCAATFSGEALAAGAPTPTLPPPAAAAATATVAPGLPSTGSSGGSSSDGALWAIVAGVVGLFALGTAGAASFRRRRA